jgi:hypothetical protein
MENLRSRYESALVTNPVVAQNLFPKVFAMTTAWMMYSIAKSCGENNKKSFYLNKIKELAVSADCDCCTDDDVLPIQILPLCTAGGTGGSVAIATCGNGIEVSSNSFGGNILYNLCLDLDVLNGNIAAYIMANPSALGDLSDVTLTASQAGEVLYYNGSEWVNQALALDNLLDVNTTGVTQNQILQYNGSSWVPVNTPFSKAYTVGSYTNLQSLIGVSGAFTNLQQTMPLAGSNNPLSANGDIVECLMIFRTGKQSPPSVCGLAFNGVFISGTAMGFATGGTTFDLLVKATITRISSTILHVVTEMQNYVDGVVTSTNSITMSVNTPTVADITNTPLVISPWKLTVTDTANCIYANYKSIKK